MMSPKKGSKDQLKRQLGMAAIPHESWQMKAFERDGRHSLIRKASRKFETEWSIAVQVKRGRRIEKWQLQVPH